MIGFCPNISFLTISPVNDRGVRAGRLSGTVIEYREQELAGLAPDGRLVVIHGSEIQLWDGVTGTLSQNFQGNSVPMSWRIEVVQVSKDGRRLFVFGSKLHVWDLTTGREMLVLNYEDGPRAVRAGTCRIDGDRIILKLSQTETRVYDGTSETP